MRKVLLTTALVVASGCSSFSSASNADDTLPSLLSTPNVEKLAGELRRVAGKAHYGGSHLNTDDSISILLVDASSSLRARLKAVSSRHKEVRIRWEDAFFTEVELATALKKMKSLMSHDQTIAGRSISIVGVSGDGRSIKVGLVGATIADLEQASRQWPKCRFESLPEWETDSLGA